MDSAALSRGGWRTYGAATAALERHQRCFRIEWAIWVGTAKGIAIVEPGRGQACRNSRPRDFRDRFSDSPMIAVARSGSMLSIACYASIAPRSSTTVAARRREGERVADGLLGVESVKRHRVLVTDSTGVWFALARGLSVADPAGRRSWSTSDHARRANDRRWRAA